MKSHFNDFSDNVKKTNEEHCGLLFFRFFITRDLLGIVLVSKVNLRCGNDPRLSASVISSWAFFIVALW